MRGKHSFDFELLSIDEILLGNDFLSILMSNEEIFRRALLQSATFLFVTLCSTCAIVIYYIFEPFLSSILWSLLFGALFYPLKTRCTSLARCYLEQLDGNYHLLVSGLIILLPIKILDQTVEFFSLLCIRKWKELIFIFICLPTVELLQSGLVYRSMITIAYGSYIHVERYVQFCDSPWMLVVIGVYVFAVLTVYNCSDRWKTLLTKLAGPMWCCALLYLSQILPINSRVLVLIGTGFLTFMSYWINPKINGKFAVEKKRASSLLTFSKKSNEN